MAMTSEERTARKFLDAFARIDFSPREFAYYITRAGYLYQFILWKVIYHLMVFWSLDMERGETKGSDKYLRQTIHAAQIRELMDLQSARSDDDEDWE
jgi:hypothetical protein